MPIDDAGTVFAYGVTSSGKTHTMHVSLILEDVMCPIYYFFKSFSTNDLKEPEEPL